jgi:hypothetical protein
MCECKGRNGQFAEKNKQVLNRGIDLMGRAILQDDSGPDDAIAN